MGLAQAADDLGQRASASRAAVEVLRLAPGDESTASAAVDILVRAAVPVDLTAGLEVLAAAQDAGAPSGRSSARRGRLLAALGEAVQAVRAFEDAIGHGVSAIELAQPLRLARVVAGRFRDAVNGALATLPPETFDADNLYAPRWNRLAAFAADADRGDAPSLLALAEAMASVGWLDESRIVLVSARAADPGDARVAARAASESAFAAFLLDLARAAHRARDPAQRDSSGASVGDMLARISVISQAHLGRDAAADAVVRRYPFIGEFAISAASGGGFETVFGSHGLYCLLGARSGGPAELVLGRAVVIRASQSDRVMGEAVSFDECWIESEGLPAETAGLADRKSVV